MYGDFTWAISDRLELTAGARYTYDKKEIESVGARQRRRARQQLQFRVLHGRIRHATRKTGANSRRALALSFDLSDDVNAVRHRIERLQVRRLRDLRLRPSRRGRRRTKAPPRQARRRSRSTPSRWTATRSAPRRACSTTRCSSMPRCSATTTRTCSSSISTRAPRSSRTSARRAARGSRSDLRWVPGCALGRHGRAVAARYRDHGRD